MNADERSRKALSLFDELVDLPDGTRASALAALRAEDESLWAEVRALLDADSVDGLLERAPHSLVPALRPDHEEEAEPRRIGPWAITGTAGRGGMGAVYLGERDDGQFHQRAAIKLIRLGMDTPQLRARFLRERQILARLKHPHVATLLDGGVTDTGAPYFAMELIDGEPIDDWCDARRATLQKRVELFLQVCAAVQHAHQNLVIHRDLKPANILIDREGRAKLLDFGIAKLLDEEGGTAATSERPHTPEFAAPEQLRGGAITTGTDVYGLGVVLHHLLAGVGPDPERSLTQAAARASLDQARARGLPSTSRLAGALKGDLSAIVGTCLHESPGQRYPTVNGLAADLRAWLAGAPVSAQNPTRAYLLRKFVRRNRLGVAGAAVLALAVIAGVAGVVWQAGKARKAAAEAQAQLDYLGSLLEVLAPSTAKARELDRSRLLADAAAKARSELSDQPASLAGVEFALARVAVGVSDYRQAIELADAAAQRRASLFGPDSLLTAEAQILGGVARTELSPPRFEEAAALLDAAIATARARDPRGALLANGLCKRATVYGYQDRLEDQLRAIDEAVQRCEGALAKDAICEEVWLTRGSIASRDRQPKLALPFLRRAYEARRRRLGKEHADTLQLAARVAWAMADDGDLAGGLALAQETHAANQRIYTQPTDTSLHATLILSRLLKLTAHFDEAEQMIAEYLAGAQKLFGEDNQNTILGHSDQASLLFFVGRFDEAAEQFSLASRGYTKVKSDVNAAITQGYAADSLREAGHADRALEGQRASVATMKRLYPKGESVMLARALANLGLTELDAGQPAAALAHDDEAVEMIARLQPGPSTEALKALRGWTLQALGRGEEAERQLRASVGGLASVKETTPNQYWEPFAYLALVACANHAGDCEALRAELRNVEASKLNAQTRKRVEGARAAK